MRVANLGGGRVPGEVSLVKADAAAGPVTRITATPHFPWPEESA